ncbi:hypothetical protein BVG80_00690 [Sphingobacteriales bacterium TSM_CSM]|nr:hypothetical protein BVG80_00690 [Sphingobacteriales bacterium TSM_CSM]
MLILLFTIQHTTKAQSSFNYNCLEDDETEIELNVDGNPAYMADEAGCTEPDAYWNYSDDFLDHCLKTSVCALDYHKNDIGFGLCTSCICEDGSTNSECPLKPDLVVSPWMAQNGDQSLTIDFFTLKLLLNTSVANIGSGPFEVERKGEYFCCPIGAVGVTGCESINYPSESCPDGFELKEKLKQIIYKKPQPPVSGDWLMGYEDNENDAMTVIYHPEHGHLHTENWFVTTLRKRPDMSDPNYDEPLNWETVSDVQKISFCIVNGKSCVCARPYACTDVMETDALSLLDNYVGTEDNIWADSDDPIWDDQEILKNKLAQFPNYLLGKHYQCEETTHQGLAPGMLDIYGYELPGNFIALPCDLAAGTYYVVMQVDPLNIYEEENNNNNVAIVPVNINSPLSDPVPESNAIITDLGEIYGESPDEVTWSSFNRINGIVKIENGKSLTIEHCTVEFMTPNSGIVVEKGGVLHVHNAVLSGNECLGNVWKGILVKGDADNPLFDGTDYNHVHHGVVHIENSIVKDALAGVQVGDYGVYPPTSLITMGGGILELKNSRFINNSVAIFYMPHFVPGSINPREATVEITAPFKADHLFPNLGYTGILIRNRELAIIDCHFSNTDYTMPEEERGNGIVAYMSTIAVGDSDPLLACTFNKMYKGIDTYAQGSLLSSVYILNNTFTSVNKGITLNGNAMSQISGNTFEFLQPDDYAIYGIGTQGIEIDHNTLVVSSIPDPTSNKPFGITLRNSGKITNIIHNNTFKAIVNDACPTPGLTCLFRFRSSVQIEGGNNSNVLIDCNNFTALGDYDIRIFDSQDFNDQGGCDPIEPNINPTANNWHNPATDPSSYHIYYHNTSESFEVTYQPGYEPTLISENVMLQEPCNTDENDCESFIFEGGEIEERIAFLQDRMSQSVTELENERFFAELIRTYLQNDMLTEAKAETQARNDNEGLKILIATYTDERNLSLADSLLQILPLQTPEDADFYDFFSAYLYELWNNSDLMPFEGKALSPAALQMQYMANDEHSASNTALFAQSAIASLYKTGFSRMPEEVLKNRVEPKKLSQNILISPNPAQNYLSLFINGEEQHGIIRIYTTTGYLIISVQTTNGYVSLNTSTLANGIYICEFVGGNGMKSVSKFVVLR